MRINSKNSMNHAKSEELRSLILDYMTAFNESDHEKSDVLLQKINQLRSLIDELNGKDSA